MTGAAVTFKLRRDVKFHDGTPFNADAVKFNFDRIVDPKFKAGGARAQLAGYAGSKVLDEFTVQVSFKTPYAPFLTYAAAGTLSMVSPKAVRETGDQVHTRPVGTGAVHDQGVRREGPRDDGPQPGLPRKAPWSDPSGPGATGERGLQVRPGGGHARDDARERRDAGHLPRPAQALPRIERDPDLRVDKLPWPGVPRICP